MPQPSLLKRVSDINTEIIATKIFCCLRKKAEEYSEDLHKWKLSNCVCHC